MYIVILMSVLGLWFAIRTLVVTSVHSRAEYLMVSKTGNNQKLYAARNKFAMCMSNIVPHILSIDKWDLESMFPGLEEYLVDGQLEKACEEMCGEKND